MPSQLRDLAAASGATAYGDAEIAGISLDSRKVKPGDLFTALPGSRTDGHRHIDEAKQHGAAAVLARQVCPGMPTLVSPDLRHALALVAAAFNDNPAQKLRLIGITGTLGKTSTISFLHSALRAGGEDVGLLGSLGIRIGENLRDVGMTTPDAPVIHAALRDMVSSGARLAAMEVTSHALCQQRTEGLHFDLGVLTNIVPDEHLEYHPTPEHYIECKLRFLDQLGPDAPLVVNVDDPLARRYTRELNRPVVDVSASGRPGAAVSLKHLRANGAGSHFTLDIARTLPGLEATVLPRQIAFTVPLIGREQSMDLALAATAALLAGAPADLLPGQVARLQPLRRRMEVIRRERPTVIDDTVGNPRSLRAVFEAIQRFDISGTLRVVFGIRGMRGPLINEALARTLAEMVRATRAFLVVTSSEDAADSRNAVQPHERETVIATLKAAGAAFVFEPCLRPAVTRVLQDASSTDVVLLLGAQGMDQAAKFALDSLAA